MYVIFYYYYYYLLLLPYVWTRKCIRHCLLPMLSVLWYFINLKNDMHFVWFPCEMEFLTTSPWIESPDLHAMRVRFGDDWWEIHLAWEPYIMHFLAYFTLQGMLNIEDHENHMRWIYLATVRKVKSRHVGKFEIKMLRLSNLVPKLCCIV